MLPSLFTESAGTTSHIGQNRQSPSSSEEEDTDNSLPIHFLRSRRLLPESSASRRDSTCDDDEYTRSLKEAALRVIRSTYPDNSDSPENKKKLIHEVEWFFLRTQRLPTTQDDFFDWMFEWYDAYWKGFHLGIPRCVYEGGRLAILDLLTAIKDGDARYVGFCSLYIPLLGRGEKLDELTFEFIMSEFRCLWRLLNKTPNPDLQFFKPVKKCLCPFKNHEEWVDCFYLNEQIRPAKWRPNPAIMGRIKRQTKGNRVLADFVERHKKGKPTPIKIEYEDHDPCQIHVIFPLALEDEMWKYKKIRRCFIMLQNSPYNICKESRRFSHFTEVDADLPENRLNSIGPRTETLFVCGVGDVEIKATTPDGESQIIRLSNVRYCPSAPCNAISIPRCEPSGVHWDEFTQTLYQEKNGMREEIAKVEEHFGFSTLEYNPIDLEKEDIGLLNLED